MPGRKTERLRIFESLLHAARAVLENRTFESAARAIFDEARSMTGATSGYVALLSDDGDENEVVFLDSGGLPCSVDPELPMPIRGLRADAYRRGDAVWDNEFSSSHWMELMPPGHVELRNVLFAPLCFDSKTHGLIGLANKQGDFTTQDAFLATAFGELAAVALHNARTLDTLTSTVDELKTALEEVNRLRGILPICMGCKKIRDDAGYWHQVEQYIAEHTDATFSHGVCDDCVRRFYPPRSR